MQYGVARLKAASLPTRALSGTVGHANLHKDAHKLDPKETIELTFDDKLLIGECGSDASKWAESGEWRTERVGPFITEPGNLVRVAWRGCLNSEALLERVAPDSVALNAGLEWIVDANGKLIGNPPIHLHGAFIQPLRLSQIEPLVNVTVT